MRNDKAPDDLKKFIDLDGTWTKSLNLSGSEVAKAEMEGVGSAGIKLEARYIIQDIGQASRYEQDDGSLVYWGWTLRLSIEVVSASVDADIDVAGFVAQNHSNASAGQMSIAVLGFNNPAIVGLLPSASSVTVSDYADIIGGVKVVGQLANDDEEKSVFHPAKLYVDTKQKPEPVSHYTRTAYELYATSMLSGHSGSTGIDKMPPPMSITEAQQYIIKSKTPLKNERLFKDTIVSVYRDFGITDLNTKPNKEQIAHAIEIADGFFTRRVSPT